LGTNSGNNNNNPIFPSSAYTFNVAAKNSANSNYGQLGIYTYTTNNLSAVSSTIPSQLFVSNNTPKYSSTSIFLVSDQSQVNYDVINISNVNSSNFSSSTFKTSVQTSSNLGLTNGSAIQQNTYLTVTADISNANYSSNKQCNQYIHGFDTSLSSTNPYYYNGYYDVSNGITLTTSVNDAYTDFSCNQGFYLMANPVMNISDSILTATNNLYTATLTTVQNVTNGSGSTNTSTYNFYCDGVNSSPKYESLYGFTINNVNYYYSTQVSGIWVISSSPTFTISSLSLSNMGDYFYISPLASYNITGGVTVTNYQESTLNNVTGKSGVSLNNTISITNSSVSGTLSSTYNNNITLSTINLYNIFGSTTVSSNLTNNVINVIVDPQSASLASNISTSIPTVGTNGSTTGYRVWSAPSSNAFDPSGIVPNLYISTNSYYPNSQAGNSQAITSMGYSSTSYYNNWNISQSSTTYGVSSELLIANGYFTTNSTYYLNYATDFSGGMPNSVNYLPTNMYQGYRYATFAWELAPLASTTLSYSNLIVNIYFNNYMYIDSLTSYVYFDQEFLSPLEIYYRVENSDNVTSFGDPPNTAWISMNSSFNQYQFTGNNGYTNSPYVYWATQQNVNTSGSNKTFTFKTVFPVINVKQDNTYYLYVRIGMPYGQYSFNNVTSQLISN
jgi:dUTPase